MSGHPRPLFVLYGASMTEYSFQPGGWGAALTDLYCRKADILLRGFRGWNTRRAVSSLGYFFPKDSPKQPDLVVVFFGANDAAVPLPSGRGQHVPINEFKDNIRQISNYLKELSNCTRVILITTPPIHEEARREFARMRWGSKAGNFLDRTNELAKEYAKACVDVATEVGVGVVDLWNAMQCCEDWQTECLSDGMHLTPKGNKVLLDGLLKVLENAAWSPRLHWMSMDEDLMESSPYDYIHPSMEIESASPQE